MAAFVVSVIFAMCYSLYYQVPVPDRSVLDRYDESVAADLKKRFAGMGELKITEPNMLQWMINKEYMNGGKATFKQNCVACHGLQGQGLVGPNLTDDNYKNVKQMTDIARVIRDGAANGTMPSWGNRMHPNEVALVAAYVAAMRGQDLPGSPPSGDKIPAWPPLPAATAPAPPDSTRAK